MSEYDDWCDPIGGGIPEHADDVINELANDCMVMAGRLFFEDYDTMAPETIEVVSRWRNRVLASSHQ